MIRDFVVYVCKTTVFEGFDEFCVGRNEAVFLRGLLNLKRSLVFLSIFLGLDHVVKESF